MILISAIIAGVITILLTNPETYKVPETQLNEITNQNEEQTDTVESDNPYACLRCKMMLLTDEDDAWALDPTKKPRSASEFSPVDAVDYAFAEKIAPDTYRIRVRVTAREPYGPDKSYKYFYIMLFPEEGYQVISGETKVKFENIPAGFKCRIDVTAYMPGWAGKSISLAIRKVAVEYPTPDGTKTIEVGPALEYWIKISDGGER